MTTNTDREALRRVLIEADREYPGNLERRIDHILSSDVWRNRQAEAVSEESVADSDTAYALGRVAGYDEAMREVAARPVITDEAVERARDAYIPRCRNRACRP